MASLDADPNSDDDLEFLTIEEVDGAENRDDELQSDIDVSDTDVSSSEEEGEPEVLNGHGDSDFDSEDDLPLADVAGRRWSSTLTPRTLRPFTGPRPGPTRQLSAAANELDFFFIFSSKKIYTQSSPMKRTPMHRNAARLDRALGNDTPHQQQRSKRLSELSR